MAGYKWKNVIIDPGNYFGDCVDIGEGSHINRGGYFISGHDASESINIGKNVFLGPCCHLCSFTHEIGTTKQRATGRKTGAISIGDGTWIGMGVSILSGVTIGSGCVVAAGTVVTHDLEANCLYAGVPAKKIRILE
ncbi:transferase [Clostridium sp. HMb25]|nr:transferase [Clostridium sp. HMb25]